MNQNSFMVENTGSAKYFLVDLLNKYILHKIYQKLRTISENKIKKKNLHHYQQNI